MFFLYTTPSIDSSCSWHHGAPQSDGDPVHNMKITCLLFLSPEVISFPLRCLVLLFVLHILSLLFSFPHLLLKLDDTIPQKMYNDLTAQVDLWQFLSHIITNWTFPGGRVWCQTINNEELLSSFFQFRPLQGWSI